MHLTHPKKSKNIKEPAWTIQKKKQQKRLHSVCSTFVVAIFGSLAVEKAQCAGTSPLNAQQWWCSLIFTCFLLEKSKLYQTVQKNKCDINMSGFFVNVLFPFVQVYWCHLYPAAGIAKRSGSPFGNKQPKCRRPLLSRRVVFLQHVHGSFAVMLP